MINEFSIEQLEAQAAATAKAQVEEMKKLEEERRSHLEKQEAEKKLYSEQQEAKKIKLELVRLAKEVLIENSRSKAVDERDVSASDITSYASNLFEYINK